MLFLRLGIFIFLIAFGVSSISASAPPPRGCSQQRCTNDRFVLILYIVETALRAQNGSRTLRFQVINFNFQVHLLSVVGARA
ncbi:hypothetical protein BGY98DRAFT_1030750 [Russula aff. rugulosa BPL654]|nr:hypothetical protein BGY98DRAFT_1030750 [Russula aff. rugulosa BPL654]